METFSKHAAEILILLFLCITFLQSGIDKIIDWKGNLSWLKDHFSKSPLKNMVPSLLATVLLTEVSAGTLCTIGLFQILIFETNTLAFYGAILSCISLLMLFLGQRLAKDYEGAKTLAIYFVSAVFLVFLLQP